MVKEKTRPLKVTAKLLDGRINSYDGIIMFDGILYHAWFAKHHPEVFETGQWMDYGSGYVGLPLRRLDGNRWWASCGVYTQLEEVVERCNRRPDFFAADKIDYLNMNKGQISDSVGIYRAYRIPHIIRIIKSGTIDFYCMGYAHKIYDLLSYIDTVGKKGAMGWGIVEDWHIEEVAEDYSYMHPTYGLVRPTPTDSATLEGYPIMQYATKPPYWKPQNQQKCYIPEVSKWTS